jgi:hypothetical protein
VSAGTAAAARASGSPSPSGSRCYKDTLQYTATIDDPGTWTRPRTLSFPWKRQPVYGMFE